MADGDTVSSSMAADWKEFVGDDMQKELSALTESVADRLRQSNESRTRLIEQTREFKRNCSEEVRVAVAPVLRGFQAEVDAAARRTKAADSALLAVYKKLVHMPAMLPVLEHAQQMSASLQKLEAENQLFKAALEQHEAEASKRELIVKELRDKLAEHDARVTELIQSKVRDRELELEAKFDARIQYLQSVQQTLLGKLGALEQRTAAMHLAWSTATAELADLRSKVNGGNVRPLAVHPSDTSVRPLLLPAAGIPFGVQLLCTSLRNIAPTVEVNRMTSPATDVPLDFRVDQLNNIGKQDDDVSATNLTDHNPSAIVTSASPLCLLPPTTSVLSPNASVSPSSMYASSDILMSQSQQVLPLCLASRPPPTSSSVEPEAKVKSEHSEHYVDLPCFSADGESNVVIDTGDVAACVRQLLVSRNIGQRQFARDILGLSQGTVSELLAKPKPWDRLTEKGKDSYRRMFQWAVELTGNSDNAWMDTSHQSDSSNAVSSTISISGYRHDNSLVTEQRVAQILNEAKAAMKAAEGDHSKELSSDVNNIVTKSDEQSQSSSVNFEVITTPFSPSMGGSSSDNGRWSAGTPVDHSIVSQHAVPGGLTIDAGNPRDIVARIYREELLKLTELAQASGNMAEYVMYERELERLSERTAQGLTNEVSPAVPRSTTTPHRQKEGKHVRAASKKSSKNGVSLTKVVKDIHGEPLAAPNDSPEDLSTGRFNRTSPTISSLLSVTEKSRDTSNFPNAAVDLSGSATDKLLECPKDKFVSLSPSSGDRMSASLPLDQCQVMLTVACDKPLESVKLEAQEMDNEDSKSSVDIDRSPLVLMQTITDSVANKSQKKSASLLGNLESSRHVLPPITSEMIKRCSNLNTEDIVAAVRTTLADYSISQRLFGESVLGLSQGSVSDLLARPKPWPLLTSKGREPFIRMSMFLDDPEGAVRRLVATQYKVPAEKLLRCSEAAAESEAAPAGRKRKNSVESSTSDGGSSKKAPRVNFSTEQKEALRRAYDSDPYPTQPSIDRLAAELGIGPRTVVNWFHNHRMRYAKQQYAATGIWSVTGACHKLEPGDVLDQSSMNDYDHESITDAGSSTDQGRDDNMVEFDVPLANCNENLDESIPSSAEAANTSLQSATNAAGGANRRKSARPQRLGAPDGISEELNSCNILSIDCRVNSELGMSGSCDVITARGHEQVA